MCVYIFCVGVWPKFYFIDEAIQAIYAPGLTIYIDNSKINDLFV